MLHFLFGNGEVWLDIVILSLAAWLLYELFRERQ